MAAMEARLPGGKKTKRNPILKLELGTGDPRNQVKIVSDTVYGLADIPHMPSREYTKWRTVDESLFGDAISAYQGTIDPFKQQPRVYKIESIKDGCEEKRSHREGRSRWRQSSKSSCSQGR